jgi:hypothetical protein
MKNFKMKMIRLFAYMMTFCALIVLTGCATYPTISKYNQEAEIKRDGIQELIISLEQEKNNDKNSIYNKKNDISFYLDRGMLNHYAGNYAASNSDLQEAERLIEEAFTKSISNKFAVLAVQNPYNQDYPGEDFENIYVNVFNALNYYHLGDLENALVEVRRINEKLVYIRDGYEEIKGDASSQYSDVLWGTRNYYSNSVLARYLGMLFWRGIGNEDNARIDAQEIEAAHDASPFIYYNSLPPELIMKDNMCDETSIPENMARINLLCFTGLSPLKTPVFCRGGVDHYANPFFSGFAYRESPVDRIEAVFDNNEKINLSLLEDIGVVTQQISDTRMAHTRNKTIVTNFLSANFLNPQKVFEDLAMIGPGGGGSVVNKKRQAVDIRMCRYLPQRAYVGALNLKPGTYSFTINYYSGDDLIESQRYENIKAEERKLNLVMGYNHSFNYIAPPERLPVALPDFPGRLSAPENITAGELKVGGEEWYKPWVLYSNALQWSVVPGASIYYVYTISGVLYGVNILPFYVIPEGTSASSFFVMAAGYGGFGIPSNSEFAK